MSTVINTNPAANLAAYNLGRTNDNLQRSLNRLSSGSRINSSYDDAGGLAVSMKMSAAIRRAESYAANIQNARSFLQTQDGALAQLGKLLERMSELKALAHDVTKNGGDISNYETEYVQLQTQFKATTAEKFNGINLFSPNVTPDPLFLKHPESGGDIQISRPTLGELNTGDALNVGNTTVSQNINSKIYEVINGNLSWTASKADAESRGGHLATVTSSEKWDEIVRQIPSIENPNNRIWLGATDENLEGQWEWVTGESWAFTDWVPGQPDDFLQPGNEDYVMYVSNDGGWHDGLNSASSPTGYLLDKDQTITTKTDSYLSLLSRP